MKGNLFQWIYIYIYTYKVQTYRYRMNKCQKMMKGKEGKEICLLFFCYFVWWIDSI